MSKQSINIDELKCLKCGDVGQHGHITTENLALLLDGNENPGGGFMGSVRINWTCHSCGQYQSVHVSPIWHNGLDFDESE